MNPATMSDDNNNNNVDTQPPVLMVGGEPIVTVRTPLNDVRKHATTLATLQQHNNDASQQLPPRGPSPTLTESFRSTQSGSDVLNISASSSLNNSHHNGSSGGRTATHQLQGNLMRPQKTGRDPLKIYKVVEVLGEGSMGRVCLVQKRAAAVGGSARPAFVREQQGCCVPLLEQLRLLVTSPFTSSRSSKFTTTTTATTTAMTTATDTNLQPSSSEDPAAAMSSVRSTEDSWAREIQTSNFFAAGSQHSSNPQLHNHNNNNSPHSSNGHASNSANNSGRSDVTVERGAIPSDSNYNANNINNTNTTSSGGSGGPDFCQRRTRGRNRRKLLYQKKSSLYDAWSPHLPTSNHKQVTYALKSIHLNRCTSPAFIQELKNEVSILKTLDHPNIVRAIETYDYRHRLYIVLELCQGGDLYTREPYTEAVAQEIARNLFNAVSYLHGKGIVHRDLKFENIMFVNSKQFDIKIIDFGLSQKFAANEHLHDQVGTVYTMSPELLGGDYMSQSDVWSLGVICFMLLSSSMPFYGSNRVSVIKKILKGRFKFSARRWSKISLQAQAFVASCLLTDPDERPTASEAQHLEWMQLDFTDPEQVSTLIDKPLGDMNSSAAITAATAKALEEIDQMDRIQTSILAFATYSRIKKLALLIVAYKSTTEEIGFLKKMYDKFDIDHDGEITQEEFSRILQTHYDYTPHELDVMFQGIDVDGTGTVHYSEFVAATLEAHGILDEERVAEAFDRLDSDDSGYITVKDLRDFLGEEVPDFYLEAVIDEADIEGDHRISYEEFIQQWSKDDEDIMSQVRSSVESRHLTPLPSFVSSISDHDNSSNNVAGLLLGSEGTDSAAIAAVAMAVAAKTAQEEKKMSSPTENTHSESKEEQKDDDGSPAAHSKPQIHIDPVMEEAMKAATCFKTQKAQSIRNAWI